MREQSVLLPHNELQYVQTSLLPLHAWYPKIGDGHYINGHIDCFIATKYTYVLSVGGVANSNLEGNGDVFLVSPQQSIQSPGDHNLSDLQDIRNDG